MVTIHFSRFCHNERQMHRLAAVPVAKRKNDKGWSRLEDEATEVIKKRFPDGQVRVNRDAGSFEVR